MKPFRIKLILIVLIAGIVLGGGIGVLLYYVFPGFFPHWFNGILLFFLLVESLLVGFVEWKSSKDQKPQKMVNVYLLTKAIKLLLSLVFIAVYVFVVKEGIKNFVLVFMLFYVVFLIVESLIFVQIEKQLKKKGTIE